MKNLITTIYAITLLVLNPLTTYAAAGGPEYDSGEYVEAKRKGPLPTEIVDAIDLVVISTAESSGEFYEGSTTGETGEDLSKGFAKWKSTEGHPYYMDSSGELLPVRIPGFEGGKTRVVQVDAKDNYVYSVETEGETKYFLRKEDVYKEVFLLSPDHRVIDEFHTVMQKKHPDNPEMVQLSIIRTENGVSSLPKYITTYPKDLIDFVEVDDDESFIVAGFPAYPGKPEAEFYFYDKKNSHVPPTIIRHVPPTIIRRDDIKGTFSSFTYTFGMLFVVSSDPGTGKSKLFGINEPAKAIVEKFMGGPVISFKVGPESSMVDLSLQDSEDDLSYRIDLKTETLYSILTGGIYDIAKSLDFNTERYFVENRRGESIEVIIHFAGDKDVKRDTILDVHGGPVAHENGICDPEVHMYRLAGYNIVKSNYSGSTTTTELFKRGYGRWGRGMQEDIYDVGHFLRKQDFVKTLGIMGGSYGGYSVLLAAAQKEGQSLFDYGISDIPLVNIYDMYRGAKVSDLTGDSYDQRFMGLGPDLSADERAERWRRLAFISPLHIAEKIKMPLLIQAGVLDGRCPIEPARQMVNVLKSSNPHPTVFIEGVSYAHGTSYMVTRLTLEFIEGLSGKRSTPFLPWCAETFYPYTQHIKVKAGARHLHPDLYHSLRAANLNWKFTFSSTDISLLSFNFNKLKEKRKYIAESDSGRLYSSRPAGPKS